MKNTFKLAALGILVFTSFANAAVDSSYMGCSVKSSTMKMYKHRNINVELNSKMIRMDQNNGFLDATYINGSYIINNQNLINQAEWKSGTIYVSKDVLSGRAGEIKIVDQFADGIEVTILTCSEGDES